MHHISHITDKHPSKWQVPSVFEMVIIIGFDCPRAFKRSVKYERVNVISDPNCVSKVACWEEPSFQGQR